MIQIMKIQKPREKTTDKEFYFLLKMVRDHSIRGSKK
jgi:hypothetical protein